MLFLYKFFLVLPVDNLWRKMVWGRPCILAFQVLFLI
jgi:hypothetical protein